MKQPHKHAEVLRAIADGIDVQWRADDWVDYGSVGYLHPNPITSSIIEWRIKPEPKPDVVKYTRVGFDNEYNAHHIDGVWSHEFGNGIDGAFAGKWAGQYIKCGKIKLTFDGETGELKDAEVIK